MRAGSFASRSSLVDVESSAHFTMSSLLALDGAMAGGRGAGEASWRSQHVPSKEEADKEALEAMREIRQFERAHMKRMENARRCEKCACSWRDMRGSCDGVANWTCTRCLWHAGCARYRPTPSGRARAC